MEQTPAPASPVGGLSPKEKQVRITNPNHHVPIEISPGEAGLLLVAKRHLSLCFPRGGEQEQALYTLAAMLLPGQCRVLGLQADYAPDAPTMRWILPAVKGDLPDYLVMFVPDSVSAREAVVETFLSARLGPRAADALDQATSESEDPILVLGGESEAETQMAIDDYDRIIDTLQALAKNGAADICSN